MKRLTVLLLALLCCAGLAGCAGGEERFVFDQEKTMTQIVFYTAPHPEGVTVPEEYLDEISDWLRTFTLGKRLKDGEGVPPGGYAFSVRVEYEDGETAESSMSVAGADGQRCLIESADAPESWGTLMDETQSAT